MCQWVNYILPGKYHILQYFVLLLLVQHMLINFQTFKMLFSLEFKLPNIFCAIENCIICGNTSLTFMQKQNIAYNLM